MTPAIIDIVIAAILLVLLLIGAKRGLFRAIAGLAILVLALVGASIAARTLTPMVSEWVYPMVEQRVSEQIEQKVEEQMPESIQKLLDFVDSDLLDRVEEAGSEAVMAAGREMISSLVYSVIHLISFILLMIGLHLLARAMDLMMKLPVLRTFNALGGAAVGLLEGILLVYFLLWLAPRFGYQFETEGTYLLPFFLTYTPTTLLSYL